jgi:hypothetical protein
LDGREVTAAERQPTDLGPLVQELRAAVGTEHVFTHEHQLRTYESDGLLQYAVTPGCRRAAGLDRGGAEGPAGL